MFEGCECTNRTDAIIQVLKFKPTSFKILFSKKLDYEEREKNFWTQKNTSKSRTNYPLLFIRIFYKLLSTKRDEADFHQASFQHVKIKQFWLIEQNRLDQSFEISHSHFPLILRKVFEKINTNNFNNNSNNIINTNINRRANGKTIFTALFKLLAI